MGKHIPNHCGNFGRVRGHIAHAPDGCTSHRVPETLRLGRQDIEIYARYSEPGEGYSSLLKPGRVDLLIPCCQCDRRREDFSMCSVLGTAYRKLEMSISMSPFNALRSTSLKLSSFVLTSQYVPNAHIPNASAQKPRLF
jgi:hypothetical protein